MSPPSDNNITEEYRGQVSYWYQKAEAVLSKSASCVPLAFVGFTLNRINHRRERDISIFTLKTESQAYLLSALYCVAHRK